MDAGEGRCLPGSAPPQTVPEETPIQRRMQVFGCGAQTVAGVLPSPEPDAAASPDRSPHGRNPAGNSLRSTSVDPPFER